MVRSQSCVSEAGIPGHALHNVTEDGDGMHALHEVLVIATVWGLRVNKYAARGQSSRSAWMEEIRRKTKSPITPTSII